MKKDIKINPIGLKGNQINERMMELMGIGTINEHRTNSVIEFTKIGPDGKAYAIVRENHEYYIKIADKTTNLVSEDFKYIGGLQNKKSEAYPSYSKAIKRLGFKFNSLAESLNSGYVSVLKNDNLVNEAGIAGFSQYKGNGFSNEGNMETNTPLQTEESDMEEEELTEIEQAVDDMSKEKVEETEEEEVKPISEHKLSILRALEGMDAIIDTLAEGKVKKKVYTLK
jgi:hypothetical protein